MSEQLGDFDERLLDALRREPRASVLSLSKGTGVPRAAISARLRELLRDEGLRIVGAVHPHFSGHSVLAHVSVATTGPIEPILAFVSEWDESVFVSVVAGTYDFIMELRTRTHAHLHELLARVRAQPDVSRINTLVYANVFKGILDHSALTPIAIDDIDRDLLRALQEDGRMSWQDLARRVGLSPSAARTRVNRVIASGTAQIVVVQERGRSAQGITCGVGMTLTDGADRVLSGLSRSGRVEFAVATVGRCDAVLTIRAATPAALHDSLEDIRGIAGVGHIETWTHLRSIKEDYARRL